jgi:hypothetical protein
MTSISVQGNLLAACAGALVGCATVSSSFPSDAAPVQADALKVRLSGQAFSGRLANGSEWDMRYAADGSMNMRTTNGADKGRWRTENNRLCVDFEGMFPSGCSEVRVGDAKRLYLKRSTTGEVVTLTAKP